MGDWSKLEIAYAGTLPRVGGVTRQDGVVWVGGPETGVNVRGVGWWAT